ncbi:MAG: hypothetical protein P9M15_04790 [Candidatus Electryoneaceae bacterium]|nr:hypothetical protein [Candidatus Electryoneaceae bacterium]
MTQIFYLFSSVLADAADRIIRLVCQFPVTRGVVTAQNHLGGQTFLSADKNDL